MTKGPEFVCRGPFARGGGWPGRQAYGLNYWSRLLAPQPSAGGVQAAWTATPTTLSPDIALEGPPPPKQSVLLPAPPAWDLCLSVARRLVGVGSQPAVPQLCTPTPAPPQATSLSALAAWEPRQAQTGEAWLGRRLGGPAQWPSPSSRDFRGSAPLPSDHLAFSTRWLSGTLSWL